MEQQKIDQIIQEGQAKGLSEKRIQYLIRIAERKEQKEIEKEIARIEAEKNQKKVKSINIYIDWVNNNWGWCPKAEAKIVFEDGSFDYFQGRRVTGCGYDKESVAVANILNKYCKYLLWELKDAGIYSNNKSGLPYGVSIRQDSDNPYFEGAVGTDCYKRFFKFIGSEMNHTENGKKYDIYIITL